MLSKPDAEIVKREKTLPGLKVLLDPESFVKTVTPFLPKTDVGTGKILFIRYKPGSKCLVLYELKLGEKVVILYAQAYQKKDLRDKLQKARRFLSVQGQSSLETIFLDDFSMMIYFFPIDRKLKVLPHLTDEIRRRRLLQVQLHGREEFWECSIETMNYKPEQRYVGKLRNNNGFSAILKAYEKSGYQPAYRNAKTFKSQGSLVIPKLLRRSRHHQLLIYEWITGKQLSDLIEEPKLKLTTLSNVGSALSVFHNQRSKELAILTRAAEAASLMATADLISFLSPKLSKKAKNLAQRISYHILDAQPVNSPIHGDFYAKQVLIHGDKVAILDYDWAALGDPAADIGNFIAHLERDALNGKLSSNRVGSLSDALIEGYEYTSKDSLSPLIILYTAVGLLRLTLDPFRYREPNWPGKTEALLDRAEQIMGEFPNRAIVQNNYGFNIKKNLKTRRIYVIDPYDIAKDQSMPFLTEALDPRVFQKEFDTYIQSGEFFKGKLSLRSIQVTRYKPGRRCLIEYGFEEQRDDARNRLIVLIGKGEATRFRKSGYKVLKSLRKNGFGVGNYDEIYVPKPIGVIPSLNMWFQKKVFGEVSTHLLTRPIGTLLARRIADAAYKIHLTGIPTKRTHTMVDELNLLHERLSQLSFEKPKFQKRVERLLKACDRVGSSISVPETCGIHRDFYPDQIVIDGTRLYVVDFDLYCNGDPALDIGNFLGHITEQSLRTLGNPDALLEVEQAMEDRFVELSGEAIRPRVQVYKTLTLVRHIYITTKFLDRLPFTEKLLALCERRLSRLERRY